MNRYAVSGSDQYEDRNRCESERKKWYGSSANRTAQTMLTSGLTPSRRSTRQAAAPSSTNVTNRNTLMTTPGCGETSPISLTVNRFRLSAPCG